MISKKFYDEEANDEDLEEYEAFYNGYSLSFYNSQGENDRLPLNMIQRMVDWASRLDPNNLSEDTEEKIVIPQWIEKMLEKPEEKYQTPTYPVVYDKEVFALGYFTLAEIKSEAESGKHEFKEVLEWVLENFGENT